MTSIITLAAGSLLWAAQAASAVPPEPQDPDRPRVSISDFKGLRENNIFSPHKPPRPVKREESRPQAHAPPPTAPPPARPKMPVVTGFFFDEASGAYQVVVEDRNTDPKFKFFDKPRFLKAGEEFMGWAVESVDMGLALVRVGDEVRELAAGGSLPEGAVAPAAVPQSGQGPAETAGPVVPKAEPAPAIDEAMRNKILEELRRRYRKKREESDFSEP